MIVNVQQKLACLRQNHVFQFNGYACSAASVAMVINTILQMSGGRNESDQVTQQQLLDSVAVTFWKDQLSHKGHHGRHGVSLTDLEKVTREALGVYNIANHGIELLRLNGKMPDLEKIKRIIKRQLLEMTASKFDYILAYFTQGEVTGEWFGSHVSPIGAYDKKKDTVLILDVDPEVGGPYEAPFDRFFEGLLGKRNMFHRNGGGWVRICLSNG